MENNYIKSAFDSFENYDALTDRDIFTKIWWEPRRVLKFINNTKYEKYFFVLLFLGGVSSAFDRASSQNLGDTKSLLAIVAGCVILGGFFWWISYYIYAALLSWTGKWLDGKGDTDSIYRIIAYAMIPSVAALFFLVPETAVYGVDIFRENGDLVNSGIVGNIVFWSSELLKFILGIFTLVFLVVGISEVQKISVGKAILNLLLPLLLFIIPVLLVLLIVYGF